MDNNTPTTPQNQPESSTPEAQPAPQFAPPVQNIAPQAPIDTAKTVKIGWGLFVLAIVITAVGLYYGYALGVSALVTALAARLGLQAKNKLLATLSIIICIVTLALFIIPKFSN